MNEFHVNDPDFRQHYYDVVAVLKQVFYDEGVSTWLYTPNRLLDGRRPMDLLIQGEHARVLGVATAMTRIQEVDSVKD